MLFLALILYLICWFPVYMFAIPEIPWLYASLPRSMGILFLLCFWIVYLIVIILDTYHPPANEPLRKILPLRGVRSVCLFIALSALAIIYLSFRLGKPSIFLMGWATPTFFVSLLNAAGIDFLPKALSAKKKAKTFRPKYGPIKIPAQESFPHDGASGNYIKHFRWTSQGREYELKLPVRRPEYERLRNLPRLPYSRWAEEYVAKGIGAEVRELAMLLSKIKGTSNSVETVMFILEFVQNTIVYELDQIHHQSEYPKYPVETLVEQTGDCEDAAILGAALLKAMGYEVALLMLPDHVALGVAGAEGMPGAFIPYEIEYKDEKRTVNYYYCEMTDGGWQIGVIPEHIHGNIEVLSVPNIIVSL